MLLAALVIAGCGGGGGGSSADVPDGFKSLTGDGWTLAYPAGWEVSEVDGSRLAQGPKGVGGLAPQTAVARDLKPPPFELSIDAFKSDQTLRRGNWKITRDAKFDLDGADAARVIEADYIEKTGTGTTPVQDDRSARAHEGRRPARLPDARAAGGLRPRAAERGPRHDPADVMRGVFSGLVGFTLAGVVLAAVLGRVLPDDWSTGAFVVVGIAAAVVAGAAGALAGLWQGPPGAAILGPLVGARC